MSGVDRESGSGGLSRLVREWSPTPRADEVSVRAETSYARADYQHGKLDEVVARLEPTAVAEGQEANRSPHADRAYADALTLLGRALSDLGRGDEADPLFRRAVELARRGEQPPDAGDAADVGIALVHLRRYDEAIVVLDGVLSRDPGAPSEVHRYRGLALAAMGRRDEGIAALRQAVDRDPSDDRSQVALAVALHDQGDDAGAAAAYLDAVLALAGAERYEDALARADNGLRISPDDPDLLAARANLLASLGRPDEALEVAERSLAIGGERILTQVALVTAYQRLGRYDDALKAADRLLAIEPKSGFGLVSRADLVRLTGRPDEALRAASELLDEAPDNDGAAWVKALALIDLGRVDDARALLSTWPTVIPGLGFVWLQLGRAFVRQERNADGRRAFEQAIELDPAASVDASMELAGVFVGDDDLAGATATIEAALLRNSGDGRLERGLADLLRRQERPEAGLEHADRAVEIDPGSSAARVVRATLLRDLNRLDEALAEFEAATRIDPDDVDGWLGLAETRRLGGMLPKALDAIDRALAIAPDHAWGIGTRGQILRALGQPKRALPDLERAERALGEAAWVVFEHGLALKDLGRLDEAAATFDRALAAGGNEPAVLSERADLERRRGNHDQALELLDRAIKLSGSNPYFLGQRGDLLGTLGRWSEAADTYEAALLRLPTDARLWLTLIESLDNAGRLEEATSAVERAIVAMGPLPDLIVRRSGFMLGRGEADAAVEELDRALVAAPRSSALLIARIRALRALGRDAEASAALRAALRRLPKDDSLVVERASEYIGAGKWSRAIALLDGVLARSPSHFDALRERARASRALNDLAGAVEFLGRAQLAWPAVADIAAERGSLLRQMGRNDEAIEALERATMLDPSSSWAFAELGEADRVAGNLDGALQALGRALELKPTYAFALGTRGQVYYARNDLEGAERDLGEALKLDPSLGWAAADLASMYSTLQRWEDCLRVAESTIAHGDATTSLYALRADALRMLSRYQEALEAADEAASRFGDPPEADSNFAYLLVTRAFVLGQLQRYAEGLEDVKRVLAVERTNPYAYSARGEIMLSIGAFVAAARAYGKAATLDPSDPYYPAQQGWALHLARTRPEVAADRLGHAVEQQPENIEWRLWYADVLRDARGASEAVPEYQKVLDATGDRSDPQTLWDVGWAHHRLGNDAEAARLLSKALSKLPGEPNLQFDLGLVLLSSEQDTAATLEYREGQDLVRASTPGRRVGVLKIAVRDLAEAGAHNGELTRRPAYRSIRSSLRVDLEGAQRAVRAAEASQQDHVGSRLARTRRASPNPGHRR